MGSVVLMRWGESSRLKVLLYEVEECMGAR